MTIGLISDRVLIRDIAEAPEMIGLIVIPELAREKILHEFGRIRIGLVLACGPGDRFIELGVTNEGEVRRKEITTTCLTCEGVGRCGFSLREYRHFGNKNGITCHVCGGSGREPVTIPTQCSPGDKVLYSRRREAEICINGELLSI